MLPPYFENIRNALIRSGHPPAEAYEITWGAIRRWAHGGGKVHPEVVAAAQAALASLKVKAGIAHSSHANEAGDAMTFNDDPSGARRFLDLAFAEALAERVPPGRPEGGRFAPVAAQLGRYDTPDQTARAVNAMERPQRAAVRSSTLPPPGMSWTDMDRLAVAVTE